MKSHFYLGLSLSLCASIARADGVSPATGSSPTVQGSSATLVLPAPGVSPTLGVSPATSIGHGQADVHLSSSSRAVTTTTTSRPAWARFASGTGNLLYLGAGILLPLVEDGPNKKQHALRAADATLTATIITEGLKRIVRERRPDSNARDSFPSGHATAAFAVATMQASFHPNQAILWYAGATVIAASRVKLRRHYTKDVIAGAAVGFLTARFELKQPRGLLLSPFIRRNPGASSTGVSVGGSF